MSEPLSWFVIEPGWKVLDREGNELGTVEETVGDSSSDIFNGLTVASGLFAKARYVPAERVDEITEGEVRLALTKDQFERLDEYREPPPSERIEPS